MVDDVIPSDVEKMIDESIGQEPAPKRTKKEPTYRMIGANKVPVAKSHGAIWKSRRSAGMKAMENAKERWDEAIRYYENDQQGHRVSGGDVGNVVSTQRLNNRVTETENIVYSNVTTMVPALYARNPKAEFTSTHEQGKRMATLVERLVNALGAKKTQPGINLKPKAKRCVVTTLLTNKAWIEIGWTFKNESSEQALSDLTELAKQLEKAKTPKDIEEVEGKIAALEATIDILQPAGPFAKYRKPHQVIVDPASKEADCSDANWLICEDFLPTEFLKARYGKKKGDEYVSVFSPSHVMKLSDKKGKDGEDPSMDIEDDYSIFEDGSKAKDFGYEDEAAFVKAQMTAVSYVWDKVTRRLYLYNSNDWKWPLWVWDDPYQLDGFFPFYPLTFFEGVDGSGKIGEVTYYLDQQDAINEINDEKRRARAWAKRNIVFNQNRVKQADVEAVLNGPDGTARGLDLPEDMKLGDVLGSITPPSMQYEALFNKDELYRTIDRISSTGDVLRGTQFKSGTTNDAVQANVSATNMRTDEKSDQIEDWIGQVYWGIAQLCLQNFTSEDVRQFLGEAANEWQQMSAQEIKMQMSCEVVGGSTKKPTSQVKKQEAIEVGQVLGQFANVTPMSIVVALKLMEAAFDEINIKEEDWTMIMQSVQSSMQQPPAGGQGQPSPQGQPNPQQGGSQQNIEAILAQMPPEMKKKAAEAIQSGEPPQQVLQDAQRMLQQVQQTKG